MKLWQKFKRLMPNRKKVRVKKVETFPSPTMTTAEMLIMNNWNITFSNPEPARAGEKRARVREVEKMKANSKIPDNRGPMTRQVRRQVERREFKNLKAEVMQMRRRRQMTEKGLIPT